ncbi:MULTISPECIES: sugar ABC transporter substrate-binding protein [Microbacterium]|uniref:sugar ABC transporter substrate-binding protein n=1 Tax=Microbacterium TaxID=33882 RepID=UPI0020161622|nr:substrate-binding domain-containing protein [Microbacterium sp. 4NA327F11]MCK9919790.1 substrate-binding domain-containing protein [Microbacteriaceae bacterium K1510]
MNLARTLARAALGVAVTVALAASLVGCAPAGDQRAKIALLLPDAKTARYESFDRPLFEKAVAALGPYDVIYSNADQDAAEQQSQAESALAAGAKVLVLDPVDSNAAASVVAAARAAGVPVIAYDRFITGGGVSYFVGFDGQKVGELQATALVQGLTDRGTLSQGGILVVNGSPTDSNAAQFAAGAASVFSTSGVQILASYSTPDWSPDKAQEWVAGQITQYGDRIVGVYAANDGVASGAIAALKAANVSPMPVVTGQDAELSAIQRIVSGDQYMTVYKAIGREADRAAQVAVELIRGTPPASPTLIDGVPSTQYQPVAVTVHDIMATVVADGFWTVKDICSPAYAAACAAAGIR